MDTYQAKIAFVIEGPDKNNKHLELSVFVRAVENFRNLLKNSAKESGTLDVIFNVVHLSHSSPARIECAPTHRDPQQSMVVIDRVDRNFDQVKRGETANLSEPALCAMEGVADFSPKKIRAAEIQITKNGADNKHIYKLNDKFKAQLDHARREEDRDFSTIDGKLEQVNIHNKANTFLIYTALPTGGSVKCKFAQELLPTVQRSLGSFVSVSGECFYRPEAASPYKIDVQEMEVLPPPEELPSLNDIYGIAPDATGGKSPEQFVRDMRDKWERIVKNAHR